MNSIRTSRRFRAVIAAMTFLGWFVLSNHCALGRLTRVEQVEKQHACCHGSDSKPAGQPADGSEGLQCCKALRAMVPDGLKDSAPMPPSAVVAVLTILLSLENRVAEPVTPPVVFGPPPRAFSFSELVLQRSVRSHAPPVLV